MRCDLGGVGVSLRVSFEVLKANLSDQDVALSYCSRAMLPAMTMV